MSAVVPHPRAVELVAQRQLRRKVEAAVDRLLAILDDLDGDPEAEPWLGSPEMPTGCRGVMMVPGIGWRPVELRWANGANDDREQDAGDGAEIEDEHGDTADLEPSLAASENPHDQRRWAANGRSDIEQGDDHA